MKNCKKLFAIISVIISILSLFSCAVYNKDDNKSYGLETTMAYTMQDSKYGFAKSNAKVVANYVAEESAFDVATGFNDRKIAKSVTLNTETKTFDATIDWLKKYVSSFDGIIDNSYIDTGDASIASYRKNAYFAVRVKAENLDAFLGKIGDNLNITFMQENISDVTDDYFDSESRLESLKIEEENLNEMLKKAKTVDEMIKVEDKLSDVRTNIENINRRIKNYDKQVNYSRVDINITEVRDLTDTKVDEYDFSKETLNKKLLKTIEDVKLFLKKVAAYIFINIPWIILILVVILIEIILYSIIKAVFFKKKNMIDEMQETSCSKNKNANDDSENENVSEEKDLDKAFEEINKVVLGESDKDTNDSDVEVEFYNKEQ